jgi:hypothetical protein
MTKFQISKDETYEVKFRDEYSEEEMPDFFELVEKIKNLSSNKERKPVIIIKSEKVSEPDKKKKRKYKKSGKYKNHKNSVEPKVKHRKRRASAVHWEDRDEAVNVLRIHYRGTPELKQRFANMKRTDWKTLTKSFSNLRKRYKITPEEVGIKFFPPRGWKPAKKHVEESKEIHNY